MPLSRRRITPYAVGLAAALALAACSSGGPAPSATRSGPSSAAVTSAPAPTTSKATVAVDPVLARIPAAARPETMEGAAAYAEFYIRQLNKAFRVGNTTPLEGLAANKCPMCSSFEQGVKDLAAEGRRYGGDLARVNYASALEFTPESRRVLLDISQMQVPVLNAAGRQVDKTPKAQVALIATLDFDGRWIVTRLQKAAT